MPMLGMLIPQKSRASVATRKIHHIGSLTRQYRLIKSGSFFPRSSTSHLESFLFRFSLIGLQGAFCVTRR